MNKLTILALSAAVTASVLAAPLASQEIVVSPSAHSAFVANVEADLDRQVQRIRFTGTERPTGVTSVRFRAGEDGNPVDVETYRRSGHQTLDIAARRAVSRLSSLSGMPLGVDEGQVIQANIIFARSERQFERLSDKLAREETQRMASSPREAAVLALTSAPRPVT